MDILFEFLLHVCFIHEKVLDNIFDCKRVLFLWIHVVNENTVYKQDILALYWEKTSLMEKLYYFRKLENINCPILVFQQNFLYHLPNVKKKEKKPRKTLIEIQCKYSWERPTRWHQTIHEWVFPSKVPQIIPQWSGKLSRLCWSIIPIVGHNRCLHTTPWQPHGCQ